MNLVRFCVERKVTVTMAFVTITLFGVMSWFRMDREFMPGLQFPQLVVLTSYPNASSAEVENLVTKAVEEAVGTVRNVQRVHSSSREGISIVTVEFLWGTNMDLSSLNLREKVDLAKAKLPRDAGEPRIEKFNPFALPVITLSLSGPKEDHELLALARRPVGELLEKTRGVAAVSITGGREREIRVELDQAALAARSLPILDVAQSIARANITYPAGTVKDKTFDYVVRVVGAIEKVPDLGGIAVAVDRTRLSTSLSPQEARRKKQQGPNLKAAPQAIRLSDIGRVEDAFSETSSYSRYDGKPNISLSILKQAEANVVRVADEVRAKLPEIQAKLPKDVQLNVVYDQSTFVKAGIHGMIRDSLVGGVLAFLVLVVFLGNLRDATVVSLAIPASILLALSIMSGRGMSLNTITLAGLAIGIGHLVDGAIVVQENIARHRHMGKPAVQAAVEGSSEVFGAVASSIATSVAVFFPLVFVTGVIGQVFGDLSYSVIFSQGVSLGVAFTLIPMLSALGGPPKEIESPALKKLSARSTRWMAQYDGLLTYAFEKPGRVVAGAFAACLAGVLILVVMPKAVFPEVEGNQLLMRLDMPVGTSLEATNGACLKVEEILASFKDDVAHRSVTVGSLSQEGLQPLGAHQAQVVLDLNERRPHKSDALIALLKERFKGVDLGRGRLLIFKQGGTFSALGGQGAPVVVEVKGHDLSRLEDVSKRLGEELKKIKGLYNVRTSLSDPAPELQLDVRRDALADVSLSVSDLAETVLMALKGKVVSKFREGGKEIDIRLRLRPEDRKDISSIESLYVHSPLDLDVPLGAVAFIREGQGPSEILHYDQQRTVLVSADLAGRSVNSVAADIRPVMERFSKEKDAALALTGESARMAESFNSLKVVLLLSIFFVFMIMASQFESLWQPFVILFTIPLALIGMAPALLLTGHKLTAMAGMGVVLLAGIVVNNGIVLVDFVNQSRDRGMSLRDALRAGCHTRMRPILMTAITTILGMLPLALGIGEGADMQAPMAVVVTSGLFVSTLLTLVVLPAIYVGVEERLMRPEARKKWMSLFSLSRFSGRGWPKAG